MRKLLTASVIAILILGGCIKKDNKCNYSDSTIIVPDTEKQTLQDSLTAHGITAAVHASGFFYKINSQGSGQSVSNLCSTVSVEYKGEFFNGKIFDSTATGNIANFQLGRVIPGWQKGVPLVSKGGNITLYIPPSLAYGANPVKDNQTGVVIIPGNSYLVYKILIVDIQ